MARRAPVSDERPPLTVGFPAGGDMDESSASDQWQLEAHSARDCASATLSRPAERTRRGHERETGSPSET